MPFGFNGGYYSLALRSEKVLKDYRIIFKKKIKSIPCIFTLKPSQRYRLALFMKRIIKLESFLFSNMCGHRILR
jgi:hypothetical protein